LIVRGSISANMDGKLHILKIAAPNDLAGRLKYYLINVITSSSRLLRKGDCLPLSTCFSH
jgi:hypothetical protein